MNPDRRRRRQVAAAGICAGVACVFVVWTLTLWPGSALILGVGTGLLVAFLYSVGYDLVTRR